MKVTLAKGIALQLTKPQFDLLAAMCVAPKQWEGGLRGTLGRMMKRLECHGLCSIKRVGWNPDEHVARVTKLGRYVVSHPIRQATTHRDER